MLVIISDLHLTDGTSGTTIGPRAFETFKDRVQELAFKASWRNDENGNRYYHPVETIDVVLLGDILDIIRSSRWNDAPNGIRPWSDPHDPDFIATVKAINDDMLEFNKDSLHLLKTLGEAGKQKNGRLTLPRSVGGKPRSVTNEPNDPGRTAIHVRLHYMVGNHDWFYHLPGPGYDEIRNKVVEAMGLANDPRTPFPHSIEESPMLSHICKEHKVYMRHGDIHDPFNYVPEKGRDASSLGDAIVVELLNRFPVQVEKELGDVLPSDCLNGLKEIDNVRPLLYIPIWINGLLDRTCKDQKLRRAVNDIWNNLADQFLDLDFVKQHDTINPFEAVDMLQLGLKISQQTSFKTVSKVIGFFMSKKRTAGETYYKEALTEEAYRKDEVNYIVYGHTHHQEIVPIDIRDDGSQVIYMNSGTWRQVYELTRAESKEHKFLGFQVMNYLGFFKDGERRGREFEVWNGSLGD